MDKLSDNERELVALGASLASHCIPCSVYHIKECQKLGFSKEQIKEAIQLAKKVKNVPEELAIKSAYAQLDDEQPDILADPEASDCRCC